jgi:hypothetical protein
MEEAMSSDLTGAPTTINEAGKAEVINATFKLVEGHAHDAVQWYWKAKKWPELLSKGLRFLALLLFGLGALPAFLHATGVGAAVNWPAWGYLALALGTSALAFDHFFGLSTAYTRYVTTAMALERARHEFRMDWLALLAQSGPVTDEKTPAAPFIKRATAFLKLVLDLVDRETQDWVAEFRANLSELEKVGKSQREAAQPGTLEVLVTGAVKEDDEVVVSVDNVDRARLKGPGTAPVGPVLPGNHLVAARNAATGMQGLATAFVGSAASTSLTVAVPAKA